MFYALFYTKADSLVDSESLFTLIPRVQFHLMSVNCTLIEAASLVLSFIFIYDVNTSTSTTVLLMSL